MKVIYLKGKYGKGKVSIVDDDDYEEISKYKWNVDISRNKPYARKAKTKKCHYRSIHRKVMNAQEGQIIDHINRDTLDNRKRNLRVVTKAQNSWNSKKRNGTSRYKGVYYSPREKRKSFWCAYITFNGNRKTIGYFKTETEAAVARNIAVKKYHKEFGILNETN